MFINLKFVSKTATVEGTLIFKNGTKANIVFDFEKNDFLTFEEKDKDLEQLITEGLIIESDWDIIWDHIYCFLPEYKSWKLRNAAK